MLIPICSILLIEHRTCKCGSEYLAPSPKPHRLYRAPIGEPDKVVIAIPTPDEPSCLLDEFACVKQVEVPVPFCDKCWQTNASLDEMLSFRPERPVAQTPIPAPRPAGEALRPVPRLEDL